MKRIVVMTRLLRQANAVSKGLFAISICTYAFLCPDWRILVGLGVGLLLVLGLTGELDRIVLLLVGVFLAALPMKGALFGPESRLAAGQDCTVVFTLSKDVNVRLRGRIVRSSDEGLAVDFESMPCTAIRLFPNRWRPGISLAGPGGRWRILPPRATCPCWSAAPGFISGPLPGGWHPFRPYRRPCARTCGANGTAWVRRP